MGDETETPKRLIRVGFIQPKELEGNIIYVQLRKVRSSKFEEVYAGAVSNEEFKCWSPLPPSMWMGVTEASNKSLTTDNYYEVEHFLESLKKGNDAEIVERYKEDGLELTDLVQQLSEDLGRYKFR